MAQNKQYAVIVKRGWHIESTRKFATKREAFAYGHFKENETYICHSVFDEVNDIYRPTYENYIVERTH